MRVVRQAVCVFFLLTLSLLLIGGNVTAFPSVSELGRSLSDKFASLKQFLFDKICDVSHNSLDNYYSTVATMVDDISAELTPNSDMELVFVQTLWQHGSRTPLKIYKYDVYKADAWPPGLGELTAEGMEQQFKLGQKLRRRYIAHLKFISPEYHSNEIYVRSTDWNRTLESASANMAGFYKAEQARRTPTMKGWPQGYMPVPVHSVKRPVDYIGNVFEASRRCPRSLKMCEMIWKTPVCVQYSKEHEEIIANMSKWAGEPLSLWSLEKFVDTLLIELEQNRQPVWITDELLDKIQHIRKAVFDFYFGLGVGIYRGINFTAELPLLQGGPMLWHFINQIKIKIECAQENATATFEYEKKCAWINRLKYYAFSGHDINVAALMVALLRLNTVSITRKPIVASSTAISIELWRSRESGKFSIKVLFWDPENENDFKMITENITGCEHTGEACPLSRFIERSLPYRPTPSIEELCHNVKFGDETHTVHQSEPKKSVELNNKTYTVHQLKPSKLPSHGSTVVVYAPLLLAAFVVHFATNFVVLWPESLTFGA